jgi:signal transduction histidine kinase
MHRRLRVLLVEDSKDDAELLRMELRRHGFEPVDARVDTRDALERALAGAEWDIVLSDHDLPGFSGTEALALARRHTPDVPFIFVSGTIGEEHAVEAMRAGASDFIVKTSLHRLAPAVERELRDAAERAEQRRIEGALIESQNQLRQAQKLEAVGRLAGGVAHDFNNLLTAIVGFADLLLDDLAGDDPHRPDVQQIRDAGARAVDLTRQLLAFSRQQVLHQSVVDLGAVVEDITRLLQRVIGGHIVLKTLTAPDLWRVKCDRGQIDQIVLNLAVNARDAMRRGGTFTIETGNVVLADDTALALGLSPGEYVRLRATDTGEGIPPEVLPHVFEPFFTTKAPGRGTGLGLSTVYGIVQQSGGAITVESQVGRGSTFTIHLPRTMEDPSLEMTVGTGGGPKGNETVLVVEDEPSVRELAVRVLRQNGYRVIAAERADAAIRMAADHLGTVDVLLTDVMMEGMNGAELADRLVEIYPSIRVVFMSGFTGHLVDQLERHSAGEVLAKPFTPAALTRRVREALRQPQR